MAEEAGYYLRAYILEDNFTSCRTEAGPGVMDGALWSQLPEDIVDKILLVLPRSSQVRFRAVSRAWRSRLTSAEFEAHSAALAFYSGRFLCGIAHRDGYPLGDSDDILCLARFKVHKLSLAYLPSGFQELTHMHRVVPSRPWWCKESPLLFHVQNGLIILGRRTSGQYKLCVVNLVNETWKEVVTPTIPREIHVMAVCPLQDEAGGYFKLLIGFSDPDAPFSRIRCVYCSKADAWMSCVSPGNDFLDAHLVEKRTTVDERYPDFGCWRFWYQVVDVEGTLTIRIRNRERDMKGISAAIRTDLQTQLFEAYYEHPDEHWLFVRSEEDIGSMIVADLSLVHGFFPQQHVLANLCLAYNIPLGSWEFLHASVITQTRPPVRHKFFEPAPSVRL